MPTLKRWLPLIGTGALAAAVLLRLFGLEDAARAVESVGGAVGLTEQSPVGAAELAAAVAAAAGIVLKVASEIKKARRGA